jgi:hypothetical protein
MHRDATDSADTVGASGTGRTALWPPTRVLLSPIQFRQRHQPVYPHNSPCSTSSSDEEDEQDFYTPESAADPAMDLYASANYSGDSNMSSEVDEDTDFYEVESSQPALMADAVRSFHALCYCPTARSFADLNSIATNTHSDDHEQHHVHNTDSQCSQPSSCQTSCRHAQHS